MQNDLIYRQAAISVIAKWMLEYGGEGEERERNALKQAAEEINDLPSAQPRQTCEYWDSESNFCALYRPSAQPKRKMGRWIKEHIDITDKEHPKSFRFHRCSVCGHVAAPALFVDEEKWLSYCPHCGAYMGGGAG